MIKRFFNFNLLIIAVVFIILVVSFRSLATHMSTNMLDWNDYPFCAWVMYQNIGHFKTLTTHGFFDTNIFWPYKQTLLFSELLLPQSLIALPFTYVFSNHIVVFNIVFFITLLLDVIAVWFFWKEVVKDRKELLFAVFATCISGFFFQNSVHFQTISFWPFFIGLSYLVRPQKTIKDNLLLGFWMGVQFLAGVYLGIFLLVASGGWFVLEMGAEFKNKKRLLTLLRQFVYVIVAFTLTAGFFVYKYMQVQHAYHIVREYWEYIYYSAHLTDYIFSTNYNSFISNLWPVSKWNTYNHAGSLFPGFLLSGLAISGMFMSRKVKNSLIVSFPIVWRDVFYFLIGICGFFASLGPRLNVNGLYATIPLPYYIPLKLLPILEPIRVNGRWYLFVMIALVYFALKGMRKYRVLSNPVAIILMCVLVVLEIAPVNRPTEAKAYYPEVYNQIKTTCMQSSQVLLEYPMTQDAKDVNVVSNLTYRTQAMLASLEHHCTLVNGYMGYAPKDYERYEMVLTDSVNRDVPTVFWKLIAEKNVRYIKLNKDSLFPDKVATLSSMLKQNKKTSILVDTESTMLVEVGQ